MSRTTAVRIALSGSEAHTPFPAMWLTYESKNRGAGDEQVAGPHFFLLFFLHGGQPSLSKLSKKNSPMLTATSPQHFVCCERGGGRRKEEDDQQGDGGAKLQA